VRAVIDTGVLVSALIRPQGTTGTVLLSLRDGRFDIVYSAEILVELIDVMARPFFRTKYHIESDHITALIYLIRLRGELVIPRSSLHVCRDPKDDKFLEAAVEGRVDYLVSGDADLLVLSPCNGIPIVTPTEFLANFITDL
jgi:uncharacterized protein